MQNFTSYTDGPEKHRNKEEGERMQEDYTTSAVYFCRWRVEAWYSAQNKTSPLGMTAVLDS